jgi:hypothetical protein
MQTQAYVENVNTHDADFLMPVHAQNVLSMPAIRPTTPMDLPVERFTEALGRRESNRQALIAWIAGNLKQGVDFGRIHVMGKDKCQFAKEGRAYQCDNPRHWSKPSLWKPGAEKICGMLGLIPRFPNLQEYERAVLSGTNIKVILLKCELHTPAGFVAAEGTGARSLAQDDGDINKSLKMTEKSAHIDATLRVAGLSEIFTQDLEDMLPDPSARQSVAPENPEPSPPKTEPRQQTQPPPETQPWQQTPPPPEPPANDQRPANGSTNGGNRITGKQFKFVMDLMAEASMTKGELNKHCIEAYGSVVDHITRADASSLIDWLRNR